MIDSELARFVAQANAATTPEALFGPLDIDWALAEKQAKRIYHALAKIAHVDRYRSVEDQALAHEAFTRLNTLWQEAQARIAAKTYGTKTVTKPAFIKTKTTTYEVVSGFATGDLATLYRARTTLKATSPGQDVLIKMAKTHLVNDLLEREARHVKTLMDGALGTRSFLDYFPYLDESFTADVKRNIRRANVFRYVDGYYPLTEVVAQYPDGVDGRHFVWMWRRLLTVLGYAHMRGIVHGAVLPTHVLIRPENHALKLVDWAYSTPITTPLLAVSSGYRGWYPKEALAKRPVTAATDIYMAARCMAYVLGGEYALPSTVAEPFQRFLQSCQLANPARRPQNAWDLHDAFSPIMKAVYAKREFVALEMRP